MISIIIIVKDDRGIQNTLEKLKNIKKPEKIEIIVVDASNGKLDDIKNNFKDVHWIYYRNKSLKKITIPEQRNLGVKNAKGDPIIFLDANCIPSKNWLVKLFEPYIKDEENIVAGSVEPFNKNTYNNLNDRKYLVSKYLDECPTINVLIRKKVFTNVGKFDEHLTFGSDVDFMWRAVEKGYKIRFSRDALIYHEWGNFKDELKRSFKYGNARIILYKKYPYRWKNLFSKDIIYLVYPVYIILLPITFFFPFYPLFILIPVIKNIQKQPLNTIHKLVIMHLVMGLGFIKGFLFN
jgi:GT2 family glycosyltransferase